VVIRLNDLPSGKQGAPVPGDDLGPCGEASQDRDLAVDSGVHHLCKTGQSLCTYWGNSETSLPIRVVTRLLTWHNALGILCVRKHLNCPYANLRYQINKSEIYQNYIRP
jgi:hypothetical protein